MEIGERIEEMRARHAEVERLLADPAVSGDPSRLRDLAREHSRLGPILAVADRWEDIARRLEDDREVARDALRLELYYLERGFREAQVDPTIDSVDDGAVLTFTIDEGRAVTVDSVTWTVADA